VVESIISLVSLSLSLRVSIHWDLRVHPDYVGSIRCRDPGNYASLEAIGVLSWSYAHETSTLREHPTPQGPSLALREFAELPDSFGCARL